MNLVDLTLTEASGLIAKQEISSEELTQAHLERTYQLEPELNCFITQTPDLALERARAADLEIQQGDSRGPLHGIPIALKDLYETQGVITTAGSLFFEDWESGSINTDIWKKIGSPDSKVVSPGFGTSSYSLDH